MPQLEPAFVAGARPRLVRIAYRMLGSLAEAEDVVQDALLRFQRADAIEVDNPEAFLAKTVARLSLDVLKSARRKRETYVGPWLPEPIFERNEDVGDDVTLTLMLALERLSPLERAAFLLHDVFGLPLAEVAHTLQRDAVACRKRASRAREHVRAARPRYPVSPEQAREVAHAFFVASRAGNIEVLQQLLAEDVVVYSDGGGKRSAATKPVSGLPRVTRFLLGLARKSGYEQPALYQPVRIDGLPGFITLAADRVPQTTALALEAGKVTAIYIVRNPDKLRHLPLSAEQLAAASARDEP